MGLERVHGIDVDGDFPFGPVKAFADARGSGARLDEALARVGREVQEMSRRIAALPGVNQVGVGMSVPLRPNQIQLEVKAEGRAPEPGQPIPLAEYRTATAGFIRARD